MLQVLQSLCLVWMVGQAPKLEAQFVQVTPQTVEGHPRATRMPRAVVLVQGLHLPVSPLSIGKAQFQSYQRPHSLLVERLAQDADVFAFAYSQNLPVTDPAIIAYLQRGIQSLHSLGYSEIVLVGFSAGGLIARQLVEDVPDAGVAKVVQVCSPNLGSTWALAHGPDPFIESLTCKARSHFLHDRPGKTIPAAVQFVCVVGTRMGHSDGVVSVRSQWPEDLEAQGVPMRTLHAGHLLAARSAAGVQLIGELVRDYQPRQRALQASPPHRRLLPAWLHPTTRLAPSAN